MGPPNRQDLKFLQTWMESPSMGNVYLLGADSDVWEGRFDPAELVCLLSRQSDSVLAGVFTDVLVKWYHRLIGRLFTRPESSDSSEIYGNTVCYSQENISRLSAVIGTVVASLLLVGSIVVLYSVTSMNIRLIIIGIFTAGFSLGLCLFTNGRMVEVFSASAA